MSQQAVGHTKEAGPARPRWRSPGPIRDALTGAVVGIVSGGLVFLVSLPGSDDAFGAVLLAASCMGLVVGLVTPRWWSLPAAVASYSTALALGSVIGNLLDTQTETGISPIVELVGGVILFGFLAAIPASATWVIGAVSRRVVDRLRLARDRASS